ncbi:MAG TPA: hypothetical protein VFB06_10160 [Streptosporangiaceae bacterium]|nr:hypothetical protein [Streptosporangiaceae bacterium]
MGYAEWAHGPFGLDAQRGQTLHYQRTVLVVVHTVTAGTRLNDVVPLLEADRRIQVVFTYAPSALIAGGVQEFLARLGGVVVPWAQATQTRFDLALAASDGLLEWVHAPVLTLRHGIGYTKYPAQWDGDGVETRRAVAGPEPARLISHGRTIAAAIVLPTRWQEQMLRRSCPEAAPIAVVAGDPCFDRLSASLRAREAYRRALGIAGKKLVAVSSTWGPGSLLCTQPALLAELADQLPRERYQLAAIIHPGVWHWHGPRQIQAWYADCVRRGLILIPPDEGWRAVVAAADAVIGDHGSVTCYAAAAGIPVLLAYSADGEVVPGSPIAILGEIAPRLRHDAPYTTQVEHAVSAWSPQQHAKIRDLVTDVPGQSANIIRSIMYRLMKLPEPVEGARIWPVPVPRPFAVAETFGQQWLSPVRLGWWRASRPRSSYGGTHLTL